MDCGDVTIIIPTLNEEGNIGRLIGELAARYRGARIIVSDDGSSDGTREEVMRRAKTGKVLFLDRSRRAAHGLTASVVEAALLARTRYIIVMDADLQHPPEVAGRIYRRLLGGADMAVGVRTHIRDWGLYRRILSWGITLISTAVFRIGRKRTVSDMMSGFFGIRRELFVRVIRAHGDGFVMRGYKVLLDTLRMLGGDAKIAEVPYATFHPRTRGTSKFKPAHIVDTLRSVFR